MLTSTGSCHLLGGREDSRVHLGSFVVLTIHSVQIWWVGHSLSVGSRQLRYAIMNKCTKGIILVMVKMFSFLHNEGTELN